jgi:hypothetical protein
MLTSFQSWQTGLDKYGPTNLPRKTPLNQFPLRRRCRLLLLGETLRPRQSGVAGKPEQ